MEKRFVYADNAATTAPSEEVIKAMMPCLEADWGNPSSLHDKGQRAKEILEDARARIAACLGALPSEIYFTSCGTESDNWAIRGAAYANIKKGKHIITSKVEHHAVLYTCEKLEKEGHTNGGAGLLLHFLPAVPFCLYIGNVIGGSIQSSIAGQQTSICHI